MHGEGRVRVLVQWPSFVYLGSGIRCGQGSGVGEAVEMIGTGKHLLGRAAWGKMLCLGVVMAVSGGCVTARHVGLIPIPKALDFAEDVRFRIADIETEAEDTGTGFGTRLVRYVEKELHTEKVRAVAADDYPDVFTKGLESVSVVGAVHVDCSDEVGAALLVTLCSLGILPGPGRITWDVHYTFRVVSADGRVLATDEGLFATQCRYWSVD